MGSQTLRILVLVWHEVMRRVTLVRALQAAIVATIVTAVLAAGAIVGWLGTARSLRWVALGALLALSLAYAWRQRRTMPPLLAPYGAAAAFLVLAYASAVWSASPVLSVARATTLAMLFVACASLAYATTGRPGAIRSLLGAVLAGTVIVAIGGLAVLALDYDRAVAPATTVAPARYQGLGGGPDTAVMVLSVGVPLALHALLAARSRLGRFVGLAAFVLLLGSIVASGSRGALAATCAGAITYALLARRGSRARVGALAAVLVVFAVAVALSQLPQPLPPGSVNPAVAIRPVDANPAVDPQPGYLDANLVLRLQDDVGHPPLGVADTRVRPRTLLSTSGRFEAWVGALHQAAERPLLGYGFGTEDRVFADRYFVFNSGVPENSYVGLLLQLGALGTAVFLVLLTSFAVYVRRGLRTLACPELALAGACAGAVAAGLVLAVFQSYFYAVGNNATAAFWLCAFLLAATTAHGALDTRS